MIFPGYMRVVSNNIPDTQMNLYAQSVQSSYHALLVRFERRYSKGFSWLGFYTFSEAITNAPQFRNAGGANGSEDSPLQDSYNLCAERGLASFDARQRSTLGQHGGLRHPAERSVVGRLVGLRHKPVAGRLPLHHQHEWRHSGKWGRHRRHPDPPQRSTERFFNTSAFQLTPAFHFGNVGRNTVIGPGMFTFDTTIARNFAIKERYKLQFWAEFFNLLNTPNHAVVGRLINVPAQFGKVLNQLDPRQIQFGLKLAF